MRRLWVHGRRVSRRVNHYFGGNPRHCLSTRIHAERWYVAEFAVNVIFVWWGWHHCKHSYEREVHNEEAAEIRTGSPPPETVDRETYSDALET